MASKLDQLREMSVVVADTGDLEAVRRFRPLDCTTNPSIVFKAISSGAFDHEFDAAIDRARPAGMNLRQIVTDLTVAVGSALARIVEGRVSTEVDAGHSFDTETSIRRAHELVEAYARNGIETERILIKLASTWEGIRAAEKLQKDGIDCNLTLLFSLAQARAAADAGAFLISPFVGRITDWYRASTGKTYVPEEDPGVLSVRRIHAYYKAHGIRTVVMGASFRSIGQIEALAGCDRLTISPALLEELSTAEGTLERKLLSETASDPQTPSRMREQDFRWELNEDCMASDKLADGIRQFHADAARLDQLVADRSAAAVT
jgi:transaldolase